MARSIAGLFQDRQSAEQAIVDLKQAGFDPSRIGIVMKDKAETKEITAEHGTHSTEGAVAGGIIGGTAGALLAAAGALVIPGVGPFISGGILASLIGGTAGWLVGGLSGLGIPEDEARYYEEQVGQGRALVTVDAAGRDDEARAILLRNGAENLQGSGSATPMATRVGAPERETVQQSGGDLRIPVREEELVVGKRMEEEGRVHVHKDVVTEQRTVSVPLQQEQVTVERVPFSGDAAGADAFTERDIEVPLMGEEAVVGKRVRGVEEVVIHKDVEVEQERVTDTVRKERVTVDGVDQSGAATIDRHGAQGASGAGASGADRLKDATQRVGDDLGAARDRLTGR